MSRVGWLLTALLALLLVILWWFLLWSPTSDEIAQVRADTESTQALSVQQRQQETELREIRQNAPEIEVELNAGQVIVPEGPALPALFRQLQQAADDSGVRLVSAAPGRPTEVAEAPGGLTRMQVNFEAEGTYFQLVDMSRRLEDPAITGRGLLWRNVEISVGEYPTLTASMGAEVFSRVDPQALVPAEEIEGETGEPVTPETGEESDDPEAPESEERGNEEEVL